jgi:hypothetical protein
MRPAQRLYVAGAALCGMRSHSMQNVQRLIQLIDAGARAQCTRPAAAAPLKSQSDGHEDRGRVLKRRRNPVLTLRNLQELTLHEIRDDSVATVFGCIHSPALAHRTRKIRRAQQRHDRASERLFLIGHTIARAASSITRRCSGWSLATTALPMAMYSMSLVGEPALRMGVGTMGDTHTSASAT